MKPGPKPMNRSQLITRGSPLADTREDPTTERQDYVQPVCPKWLDRVARKEWRRVLGILEKQRSISEADGIVLALCCDELSSFLKVRAECEALDSSDVVSAGGQCYQHPAVNRKNACIKRLHKLAGDLFMSPSSRKSLRLPALESPVASSVEPTSSAVVKDAAYWEELSKSKDRFFSRRAEWLEHISKHRRRLVMGDDGELVELDEHKIA